MDKLLSVRSPVDGEALSRFKDIELPATTCRYKS
jgi:hypothetical protein